MSDALKHLSLLVILLAITIPLQAGIKGIVKSSDGNIITGATVLLYDVDGKVLAYAISDKKGIFNIIDYPEDKADYILVKSIGYKTKKISVNHKASDVVVLLEEDDQVIEDVVVKAKPIYQMNDTTRYLVTSFSDGMESNIEDLLRKLPGISVSDDGSVSFKGKSVSKILLDKSDLFGENYKLASKTIPVDFVGTIEAIEHYQDVRQLKGIEKSNDVVLNLNLKSGLKVQKPVGYISAGAGVRSKNELDANMLLMSKHVKLYDTSAFSNLEPSALVSVYKYNLIPAEVVTDYSAFRNNRENIKFDSHKSFNNGISCLFQPSEKINLKEQFSMEKNKNYSSNKEILSYADNTTEMRWNTSLRNRVVSFLNDIQLKYDIDRFSTLTIHNKIGNVDKHVENQFEDTIVNMYPAITKALTINSSVNFVHSCSKNSVLMLEYMNSSDCGNQEFAYRDILHQKFDTKKYDNRLKVNLEAAHKYWKWNVESGLKYVRQKLNNSLTDANYSVAHNDLLGYAKVASSIKIDNVTIDLSSLFGYWKQRLISTSLGRYTLEKLKVNPSLTIEYEVKKHQFSFGCSYVPNSIDPMDYIMRFCDNRQLILPAARYNDKNADLTVSSSYMCSFSLNTMLMIMYMYNKRYGDFIYNYDISELLDLTTPAITKSNDSQQWTLSMRHYMESIRHGVNLSANYNTNIYYNFLGNNKMNKIRSSMLTGKLLIRSALNGCFNYVVGGMCDLTRCRIGKENTSKTSNYSLLQEILLKACNLRVKLSFDEYFLGDRHKFYFFMSPDIKYELKKTRLSVGFSAYNVFNIKTVSECQVNDLLKRTYIQDVVPAYYVLTLRYRY